MSVTGYHSEWITIKNHRILLECRASFPDETMKFIAKVAVETIDNNSDSARVVNIFYDDKSSFYFIKIASTLKDDKGIELLLQGILHNIFGNGNCQVEVVIVKKGDTSSDHYHHMEHLSIEADVCVNRWKHDDEKYKKNIKVLN